MLIQTSGFILFGFITMRFHSAFQLCRPILLMSIQSRLWNSGFLLFTGLLCGMQWRVIMTFTFFFHTFWAEEGQKMSKMTELILPFVIILSFLTHAHTQCTKPKFVQILLIQRTFLKQLHSHLKCVLAHYCRIWSILNHLYQLILQEFILTVKKKLLSAVFWTEFHVAQRNQKCRVAKHHLFPSQRWFFLLIKRRNKCKEALCLATVFL